MRRAIRLAVTYDDASPEAVWRALTDPATLASWLMANDFEPKVGHQFTFRDKPQHGWDGVVHCTVLSVDPGRQLSYSWKSADLDTTVTWSLSPHGKGTRLVLEHTGFRGLKARFIGAMLRRGWRGTLLGKRLPAVLGASATSFT